MGHNAYGLLIEPLSYWLPEESVGRIFARVIRHPFSPEKILEFPPRKAPKPVEVSEERRRARIIVDRVLAEEGERSKGRVGRPPSGRVTISLIEKMEIARRFEEADALRLWWELPPFLNRRRRELPAEQRPDEKAMAWHRARVERERAEDARRLARERAAWKRKANAAAKAVPMRLALPLESAHAFAGLARSVGVEPAHLGRLILVRFAALPEARAHGEIARLLAM